MKTGFSWVIIARVRYVLFILTFFCSTFQILKNLCDVWYDTFYSLLSNLLPLKDFNFFTIRRVKQIFDHFTYILYSLFWLVLYILRWLLNLNMLATLYSSLFTWKNKDHPKGQIISKCLFGVFNFFQKTNKNTSHTSKNEFIHSFFGRIHDLTICFRN